MRDLLTARINKFKHLCDYMEIRIEDYITTYICITTDTTDLSISVEMGGNVRALVKGGWGFTSFNNLNLLDEFAAKAIEQAKKVGKTKTKLAPVPVTVDYVKLNPVVDPRGITITEKKKLLDSYNTIVLNYDKKTIRNSIIKYREVTKKKYFSNSEGTYIEQELLDLIAGIIIIAQKDGITQKIIVADGTSNDFSVCRGLEEKIEKACNTAISHLGAPVVKGGSYTVIYNPDITGTFAHEAFGHTCEADFYKDKAMKEEMQMGRIFGSKILNIYDTGLDIGSRGCMKYDDEGVNTEKTYLIKEGVLAGRLHSRETASMLQEKPTGSARAVNYKFPPICRMRNTCIEGDSSTFQDMLKDIKTGLYVVDSIGGRGGESFTVIPACSYMIRDGELAEPVRNVKIMGNLFETLKNIDMIGTDFKISNSSPGCTKIDQTDLPITRSGPHIRIQNVTVGGSVQ